jgi:hypothetical protein
MASLNQNQVNIVHDLLVSQGVSYKALQLDLLDHLCCMVEKKMDNGLEFEESLSLSTHEFGLSNFSEIQEATFHLLTSKLNKMKKVISVIAIVTALFVMMGIGFKIYHYQGAGVLLIMGFLIGALVVFPSMMYFDLKSSNSSVQKGAIVSGYLSGTLLSLATLFKFMHWPGFFSMYSAGLVALIFVFIPLYTFKNYKTTENKLFAVAKSMLIMAGVATIWASYKMVDLTLQSMAVAGY